MREVQLVKYDLEHHTDAGPKVAQGMVKSLCPDRASDRDTPRILLLFWKPVEYSCATLFGQLDDLHGW